jgi:hypothetical protein
MNYTASNDNKLVVLNYELGKIRPDSLRLVLSDIRHLVGLTKESDDES